MRRRFVVLVATAAVVIGLSGGQQAKAQWVVLDPANLVEQILDAESWIQQYAQMASQIEQQAQQILQLEQQIKNTTGGRGFETLLNSTSIQAARVYLPADLQNVVNLYSQSVAGYSVITNRVQQLITQLSSLPAGTFAPSSKMQGELTQSLNTMATERAMAEQAYAQMTSRLTNTQGMISAISTTNDPKSIAELRTWA